MGNERHTFQWRFDAITVLHRVTAAERRLAESISVNKVTLLAAADELQAATKDAEVWLTATPCCDTELTTHVAWMLNTCTEVALAAQRAVADPAVDTKAVMDRLRHLLTIFDFDQEILDAW